MKAIALALLLLCGAGCAKTAEELGAFPCAEDDTCPAGYACNASGVCETTSPPAQDGGARVPDGGARDGGVRDGGVDGGARDGGPTPFVEDGGACAGGCCRMPPSYGLCVDGADPFSVSGGKVEYALTLTQDRGCGATSCTSTAGSAPLCTSVTITGARVPFSLSVMGTTYQCFADFERNVLSCTPTPSFRLSLVTGGPACTR